MTDEPAGYWEYQEFTERLYGRVRFKPDGWPPDKDLPNVEMVRLIDIGVKRLLARARRDGWSTASRSDAKGLWQAQRIGYTLKEVGVWAGKYEVSFHQVRMRCRRWVPAGSEL